MDTKALRAVQAPLKETYKQNPSAALVTLKARGELDDVKVACKVETGRALAVAGLHPATGGSGVELCSGDMLLEALVACAGVTLKAVATALEIPLQKATVRAEGDLDFRGTLGVDRAAPVGFRAIRLAFDLETDVSARENRHAPQADRALLRRLPDAEPQAGAERHGESRFARPATGPARVADRLERRARVSVKRP